MLFTILWNCLFVEKLFFRNVELFFNDSDDNVGGFDILQPNGKHQPTFQSLTNSHIIYRVSFDLFLIINRQLNSFYFPLIFPLTEKHFKFNFPPSSIKNNQINSCKKIRKFIEDGKEFSLEKRRLFDFNFQIYGDIISTIKR